MALVGDGNGTLIWEDRWLDGYQSQELEPTIYDRIRKGVRST